MTFFCCSKLRMPSVPAAQAMIRCQSPSERSPTFLVLRSSRSYSTILAGVIFGRALASLSSISDLWMLEPCFCSRFVRSVTDRRMSVEKRLVLLDVGSGLFDDDSTVEELVCGGFSGEAL